MKLAIAFTLGLALVACGKKKEEPAATPPAGSGSAMMAGSGSAAAGSGSAAGSDAGSAAAAAVDVPTEVDFEDQAKTDLTEKNVEAQVKELEKDLGSH